MKRRKFVVRMLGILGAIAIQAIPSLVKPLTAYAAGFPKPGKKDRCAVCGMFVHKYPKWAAGFVFGDGAKHFHCCPKCMLHNLNNVPKYQVGKKREDIELVWVTEYYTTKKMDARDVDFVVGTSLVGPMGLDLVPVKGKVAAETLKRDYAGKSVLRMNQITPEVIARVRKGRHKR